MPSLKFTHFKWLMVSIDKKFLDKEITHEVYTAATEAVMKMLSYSEEEFAKDIDKGW